MLTFDLTSFTVISISASSVQLSVAVKVASSVAGISPAHDTVTSVGKSLVKIGFVVSSTVNIAVVVDMFPQASVAVKVTVMLPAFPQVDRNAAVAPLFDQVTVPQLSVAIAPPLVANQALNSV